MLCCNPVYPIPVFMVPVITHLLEHKQQDDQGASQSDSKTCDIDQGYDLVFKEVSDSCLNIMKKHLLRFERR